MGGQHGKATTVLGAQAKPLAAGADEPCQETVSRQGFDAQEGCVGNGRRAGAAAVLQCHCCWGQLSQKSAELEEGGQWHTMGFAPILDPFCPLSLPNLRANEI